MEHAEADRLVHRTIAETIVTGSLVEIDPARLRKPVEIAGAARRPIETAPTNGAIIRAWDGSAEALVRWTEIGDSYGEWRVVWPIHQASFTPTHWEPMGELL